VLWSGGAQGTTAGPTMLLALLDGGDVEVELGLVGNEHDAAAEGLVELHVVVAARELAGDLKADALVCALGSVSVP